MHIFFASHDGQTRKIAEYIAKKLSYGDLRVVAEDLATTPTAEEALAQKELLVVIGAIRYGFHLRPADRFLATYRRSGSQAPLVVISVNLTARKAKKKTAAGNAYLRHWLQWHKLRPIYAVAIAGKLDYPNYGWFDRTMIRLIMTITGGPTDPSAVVEYTSWDEVDAAAAKIAALNADL